MYVFYTQSAASQSAGQQSLGRIYAWQDGRDAPPSITAKDAQYTAVLNWGVRDWAAVARLTQIIQPTLVLQGDHDIMIPTSASYVLAGLIPDAQIRIFADASHGSIFQYPEEAADETLRFLS